MNDLISRSKLKETLIESLDDGKIQEALNFFGIYDFINNAPTAYNVKNVVEQIEKQIKWYDEYENICLKRGDEKEAHTFSCLSDGLHQALEFVRNGGNADVSEINVGNNDVPIEMMKLDDDTYVPKECCTVTNPITSGGMSLVDDVDMPCGVDCKNDCSSCIIQRIMNEYAKLTKQVGEKQ